MIELTSNEAVKGVLHLRTIIILLRGLESIAVYEKNLWDGDSLIPCLT